MCELLYNEMLIAFEMLGLAAPAIYGQVHSGLDRVEPSHFNFRVTENIHREPYGLELLRLTTINDRDLVYIAHSDESFLLK